MIVLNNFPIKTDSLGDKKVETIMIPSNKREAPVVSPLKPDDNGHKIPLGKNIAFLQKQHEAMLKGLHQEIESLKKINKGCGYFVYFYFFRIAISSGDVYMFCWLF